MAEGVTFLVLTSSTPIYIECRIKEVITPNLD